MSDVFSNFDLVVSAFLLTIELFLVSGIASLVLGTALAAARVGPIPVLSKAATLYVTIFRNTPLLMIFIFMVFGYPQLDGPKLSFFAVGCISLTVYTTAFVCEAVRSGVNSVPLGQAEAARAVGLDFGATMRQVILPQAVRAALPPLASVQIALLKNTSVAAAFGLFEATARMRYFVNRNADQSLLIFLIFAIGYVILVEVLSAGALATERRWKVSR